MNPKKTYIATLSADIWRSEVWFSGEEDRDEEFAKILIETRKIKSSNNFADFFNLAVTFFEENQFFRIQK